MFFTLEPTKIPPLEQGRAVPPWVPEAPSHTLMLALEPRLLFDASGLIAGLDLIPGHESMGDSGHEHGDDPSATDPGPEPHAHDPAAPEPVFDGTDTGHFNDHFFDTFPADSQPGHTVSDLVIIDPRVEDYQSLVSDLPDTARVVVLDPGAGGVDQILAALSQHDDIQTIHIISHGESGSITLGNTLLSSDTIDQYSDLLADWGDYLSDGADILIYGCNVSGGTHGQAFVAELADITGADVAASDDLTGAADLGGDWDLETRIGIVESGIVFSDHAVDGYTGTLAEYTVTQDTDNVAAGSANQDDGLTLREAIVLANNNPGYDTIVFDTVVFDPALDHTISLNDNYYALDITDELYINGDLDGDGTPDITVAMTNDGDSVFKISGTTATLNGLTIQDGYHNSFGAGVFSYNSDLTLNHCEVSYNKAGSTKASAGLGGGGGIYQKYGTLKIYDSNISHNTAEGGHGGGIHSYHGALTIKDSTITYNTATYYDPAGPYSYCGGGIFHDNGTLKIYDGDISYNVAEGNGGGIYHKDNSLAIYQSSLYSNYSTENGGGIFHKNGSLTLTDSYVYGNGVDASFNSVGYYDHSYYNAVTQNGGGIYHHTGDLTINGGGISYNSATQNGGGIYHKNGTVKVYDTNFYQNGLDVTYTVDTSATDYYRWDYNAATQNGGGIWHYEGDMTIKDSRIIDNSALVSGGGIFHDNNPLSGYSLDISGSRIFGNGFDLIRKSDGLPDDYYSYLYEYYTPVTQKGGGIFHDNGNMSLSSFSFVSQNSAIGKGGGIYKANGDLTVSKSFIGDNGLDVTIKENIGSGYYYRNYTAATQYGGGIWHYDGNMTMEYSLIVGNSATKSGGGIFQKNQLSGNNLDISGTHIYGNGLDVTIKEDTASKDYYYNASAATEKGGGIYQHTGDMTISSYTSIFSNTAVQYGGGIWHYDGRLYVSDTYIYGNGQEVTITDYATTSTYDEDYRAATQKGGGIFHHTGDMTVENSAISYNYANVWGGGIAAENGTLNIHTSTFYRNTALPEGIPGGENGGGSIAAMNNTAYIYDTTISESEAYQGGGIMADQGSLTISGSLIADNSGIKSGGGIYSMGAQVSLTNSTISGNTAPDLKGGSIYSKDGIANASLSLTHCTLADNTGGGLYHSSGSNGSMTLGHTIVADGITSTVEITSHGYNLFSQDIVSGSDATDILGGDAGLEALADNGGATWTHALKDSSDALEAGSTDGAFIAAAPATDQRGAGHPRIHGIIDIGAMEMNTSPTAQDDAFNTDEDSQITNGDILSNDHDPDFMDSDHTIHDTLTVTGLDTTGTKGVVTLNGDGTFNFDPNGQFEYLNLGETETTSFTYTVADGYGGTDTATVTISISGRSDDPGNLSPNAAPDERTTDEDTPLTAIDVLDNDTDPDSADTLTVSNLDTTDTRGQITANGDGTITYDPNGQFDDLAEGETATDTFDYTISDGRGGTDTATVTITITGKNDDPDAVPDEGTTDEDTPLAAIDVLDNDTDPDNSDTLTVSDLDTTGTKGKVTDNGDGTFDYDPSGRFDDLTEGETATDTFTYTISDGNGGTDTATVTITINGKNDDPANSSPNAFSDAAATDEDTAIAAINVLANDTDPDSSDTLTVTGIDTAGTRGEVTINGNGTITYDPNGQFDYLAEGETATDTFGYTISDGCGGTDTATVTITITGKNDAPDAVPDEGTTDEDTPLAAIDVLDNDTDPDNSDTLTVSDLDTNGTKGKVTDNGDGTFDYYPSGRFDDLAEGETATDTFTYTISDGNGGTDTATVTITINGKNDDPANSSPNAFSDAAATDEDTAIAAINVLANDTDPDSSDTLTVTGIDTAGTKGIVTDNGDGTFKYDPNGQFNYLGSGDAASDSFIYTISDGNGGTDTAKVTITITGKNDDPANSSPNAVANAAATDEDTAIAAINVLDNDTDPDASDTLTVTGLDTTGTKGKVTDYGDGTFDYDPSGKFDNLAEGETDTDTFTYTISDGNGGTDTATVTITITGKNDDPHATADEGATDADTAITTDNVLDNDTDPDSSDTLTVSDLDTSDTKGQVTDRGDGTFTYDPGGAFDDLAEGKTDTDTFTYTVSDGHGGTDTATVTITVTGKSIQNPNTPPTANPDQFETDKGTALTTGNVLANDTDPDASDTLSVTGLDTAVTKGKVLNNGDGTFDYDPNGEFDDLSEGETATDTFTYTVSDGSGGTDTAAVTITITGNGTSSPGNNDTSEGDSEYLLEEPAATSRGGFREGGGGGFLRSGGRVLSGLFSRHPMDPMAQAHGHPFGPGLVPGHEGYEPPEDEVPPEDETPAPEGEPMPEESTPPEEGGTPGESPPANGPREETDSGHESGPDEAPGSDTVSRRGERPHSVEGEFSTAGFSEQIRVQANRFEQGQRALLESLSTDAA